MSKWSELAAALRERDKRAVDEMNNYYGGGSSLENRIALADGRAVDALAILLQVLEHLDTQDKEQGYEQRKEALK